jgi:hypothetical protein
MRRKATKEKDKRNEVMRRKATKDDIGKKAWFRNEDWQEPKQSILKEVKFGYYYCKDIREWKHCEVECEEGQIDIKADVIISEERYNKILSENENLKAELAELAELKKGEVETECWYLVEDGEGDLVMWLTADKKWSIYLHGNRGLSKFKDYTIKERLYKASEVSG